MKIAGLMMVRNGQHQLQQALDAMAEYCDVICVINDRSRDGTSAILADHPSVSSAVYLAASISEEEWFFAESLHFNTLYRLADYHCPDWVVLVDVDDIVEPGGDIRGLLETYGPEVVGILAPRVSVWRDPEYPLLVPLMGPARTMQCNIWRYFPGLVAPSQRLHNHRMPAGLEKLGDIRRTESIVFYHYGWDTLAGRIEKVDLYTRLDPSCELNHGVPYDKGLLFGYGREKVEDLIRDYRIRYAEHLKRIPGSAAPISGVTLN